MLVPAASGWERDTVTFELSPPPIVCVGGVSTVVPRTNTGVPLERFIVASLELTRADRLAIHQRVPGALSVVNRPTENEAV